jgi:hypothetical protein
MVDPYLCEEFIDTSGHTQSQQGRIMTFTSCFVTFFRMKGLSYAYYLRYID